MRTLGTPLVAEVHVIVGANEETGAVAFVAPMRDTDTLKGRSAEGAERDSIKAQVQLGAKIGGSRLIRDQKSGWNEQQRTLMSIRGSFGENPNSTTL